MIWTWEKGAWLQDGCKVNIKLRKLAVKLNRKIQNDFMLKFGNLTATAELIGRSAECTFLAGGKWVGQGPNQD